jgi:hypothetical protein
MNDLQKESPPTEFESVMRNIESNLDEARRLSEVLYEAVCRLHTFNLKCDDQPKNKGEVDQPSASTHLTKLIDVNLAISYLNEKNNEIASQLLTLI